MTSQLRSVLCLQDGQNYTHLTFAFQDPTLETRSSSRKAAWLHSHVSSTLRALSPRTPFCTPLRFCSNDAIWRGRHRATNADRCVARARANSHALRPHGRREGRAARPPRVQCTRARASSRGTVLKHVDSRQIPILYAIGFCTCRIT